MSPARGPPRPRGCGRAMLLRCRAMAARGAGGPQTWVSGDCWWEPRASNAVGPSLRDDLASFLSLHVFFMNENRGLQKLFRGSGINCELSSLDEWRKYRSSRAVLRLPRSGMTALTAG